MKAAGDGEALPPANLTIALRGTLKIVALKFCMVLGGDQRSGFRGRTGGTRGGTWVDITATNGTKIFRIQTVTTLADGVTPTASEAAAAARIRAAFPNDQLILVSKSTGKEIP